MTTNRRRFLLASVDAGLLAVTKPAAGLEITPHAPPLGLNPVYMLQFASRTPNFGKHQEDNAVSRQGETWFGPAPEVRKGVLTVPQGPGLGVTALAALPRKAKRV